MSVSQILAVIASNYDLDVFFSVCWQLTHLFRCKKCNYTEVEDVVHTVKHCISSRFPMSPVRDKELCISRFLYSVGAFEAAKESLASAKQQSSAHTFYFVCATKLGLPVSPQSLLNIGATAASRVMRVKND